MSKIISKLMIQRYIQSFIIKLYRQMLITKLTVEMRGSLSDIRLITRTSLTCKILNFQLNEVYFNVCMSYHILYFDLPIINYG